MATSEFHILLGWSAMLLGAASGAVAGLFFHREDWAGGYASFRRRMIRLGHISFFGLGLINLNFGLTVPMLALSSRMESLASVGFILGLITMPACCFLSAWRKPFRHFFPIPVVCILAAILTVLLSWSRS